MNKKITYRNNGFGMGRVCVEVDISKVPEGKTAQEEFKDIQMLIKSQLSDSWIIGVYKHRIPLIFAGVYSDTGLTLVHEIIKEFRNKQTDISQLPKYIAIDIYSAVSISREFITTMQSSPTPIYISLVDINGQLDVDFVDQVVNMNFGTNKANPIDYTLILDDISIVDFENYKGIKQHLLLKIKRKLVKAYVIDDQINLLHFAAFYGFRYSNPIRDDFSSFHNIIMEIRGMFNDYESGIKQLTQILTEGK